MKRGLIIALLAVASFFLLIFLVGGFIYFQLTSEPKVPDNVFLTIDLNQPVVDHETSPLEKNLALSDLWIQIRRAEQDSRIQGLLIQIDYLSGTSAAFEEIGSMLRHFRQTSGKPVISYIVNGGLRDLYLSSFADKVYAFKGNDLFISGLAGQATFIRKTLDLLGVQSEFFHIGAYKTASNMYTHSEMTPEHRESFTQFFGDLHQSMVKGIAVNRNLDAQSVEMAVQDSPINTRAYLEAGLLDGICYPDEVLKLSGYEHAVPFPLETYMKTSVPRPFTGKETVALVFCEGEIHQGNSGKGGLFGDKIMGAGTVAAQLRRIRKNPRIKAVVLRINSPGGSALASDLIFREAELLAKEKPLVVSMGGMAASGGYWMSMPARHIVSNSLTVTGSIGVLFGKFNLKGFYDKIGITKETIKTSPFADIFSDYRSFSDEEKSRLSQMMLQLYKQFIAKVAESRKMSAEEVDTVAQGRIWSGERAHKLKLVDQIGGLWQAVEAASRFAELDIDAVSVTVYPRKKDLMDMVWEMLSEKTITASADIRNLEKGFSRYKKAFFPALRMAYSLDIQ